MHWSQCRAELAGFIFKKFHVFYLTPPVQSPKSLMSSEFGGLPSLQNPEPYIGWPTIVGGKYCESGVSESFGLSLALLEGLSEAIEVVSSCFVIPSAG